MIKKELIISILILILLAQTIHGRVAETKDVDWSIYGDDVSSKDEFLNKVKTVSDDNTENEGYVAKALTDGDVKASELGDNGAQDYLPQIQAAGKTLDLKSNQLKNVDPPSRLGEAGQYNKEELDKALGEIYPGVSFDTTPGMTIPDKNIFDLSTLPAGSTVSAGENGELLLDGKPIGDQEGGKAVEGGTTTEGNSETGYSFTNIGNFDDWLFDAGNFLYIGPDDYSAETVGSLQDGDIYLINAEDVARNGDILSASKIEDGNSTFSVNIDGYML